MRTFIVDAFTKKAFGGNPAGICLPENEMREEIMQSVASELNLSETAFVKKVRKEDSSCFTIRYFTPTVEIPFCGHATLATFRVLFSLYPDRKKIVLQTYSGLVVPGYWENEHILIDFPVYPPSESTPGEDLFPALGISKADVLYYGIAEKSGKGLLVLKESQMVRNLTPDFTALARTETGKIRGLIVTADSDTPGYDFISRCFCPWIGINEDPVTGVAHSVLAPYWQSVSGKNRFTAFQASKRGGELYLNLKNDSQMEVTGDSVIVFEGNFLADS
ncbi:MAG: PhzF family phenazine biosynthesis protein [Bacteroidia bacterium]|nr:PhzF family phenazine biosynthesis protein [Bacteroidia bacterium]